MQKVKALFSKPNRKNAPRKTKERSFKLPSGWYWVVWEGHHVVMNQSPVWSNAAEDAVYSALCQHAFAYLSENRKPAPLSVLLDTLRRDDLVKENVSFIFDKAGLKMHEVDYEIGIRKTSGFLRNVPESCHEEVVRRQEAGHLTASLLVGQYYFGG